MVKVIWIFFKKIIGVIWLQGKYFIFLTFSDSQEIISTVSLFPWELRFGAYYLIGKPPMNSLSQLILVNFSFQWSNERLLDGMFWAY